jgi:hypothetical protein
MDKQLILRLEQEALKAYPYGTVSVSDKRQHVDINVKQREAFMEGAKALFQLMQDAVPSAN